MFDADFDAFNSALYNEKEMAGTNTILSATERQNLLHYHAWCVKLMVKSPKTSKSTKTPTNGSIV